MPRRTATFFALLLTVAVTLPAAAQTSTRSQIAKQTATQAATVFADAALTYEDIVNLHLADRRDALRLHLGSGRGALTRLRRFLKEDTAAALDRYNKEMETAEASGDLRTTALTAAEAYKTVLAAMNPKMRSTPIEVSMYKYWTYRLIILASSEKILWHEVAASSNESEKATFAQ